MTQNSPDLSIIILNYNVKDLLIDCLESIFQNKNSRDNWQIIVVDNASDDGSAEALRKKYPQVELVVNKKNLGFAGGNNVGVKLAKAPIILFLNPDTIVLGQVIQKSYQYIMGNPDIGALTCRVELPNGQMDYSCHRGFPTPWNSLMFFSGMSKLFPNSAIFSGYNASYLDTKTTHEIDCLTGAFMMVRKIAGEQINWWDTDYFFNGEDIEFCYQLKLKGWKIYFYPEEKILHFKGSSSGLKKSGLMKVNKQKRMENIKYGISAMRIFYLKHFYKVYPPLLRDLVLSGIKILEHYRKFKVWVS